MQTDPSELKSAFESLKAAADQDPWPSVGTRREWLRSLKESLIANRARVQEAVWEDFRKPAAEADLSETLPVLLELANALRNLKSWSAPRRLRGSFPLLGISSRIQYRPKGTALIIAPWNYPINLSLGPLVASLAAGNRAMLKPSERVPNSTDVVAEIVRQSLPSDVVMVVKGGPSVGEALLDLPFDHFFFTGGSRVGRLVGEAAARHASTVTLELGGKSPAVIHESVDMPSTVEKIVRGKFLNGGQTCIAPDYVVVEETRFDAFLTDVVAMAARFAQTNRMSQSVDERHASRLAQLLSIVEAEGAVIHGAEDGIRFVTGIPLTSPLMQEEIFGPILPILRYRSEDELLGILAQNPWPLSAYVFSKDDSFVDRIATNVQTGVLVVNETLVQFVHPNVPFGGVKSSGMGRSHGKTGFETFSNLVPTVRQNLRRGILPLLYPPGGKVQEVVRKALFRLFG